MTTSFYNAGSSITAAHIAIVTGDKELLTEINLRLQEILGQVSGRPTDLECFVAGVAAQLEGYENDLHPRDNIAGEAEWRKAIAELD